MAKRMAIVSGNISKDLVVSKTTTGKTRVKFSVAVNEMYDGNKIVNFIPCTAYGSNAEYVNRNFGKGKPIEVVGRLNPYRYEVDGEKRTGFEVIVDNVDFCPVYNKDNEPAPSTDAPAPAAQIDNNSADPAVPAGESNQ